MEKHKAQRVGVFVDVQNLYYSAKNLYGRKVNFKTILKAGVSNIQLIRAVAYVIKADVKEGVKQMKTVELKLNVPEEILYTLNENKNDFIKQMKFYTALELFKIHKLSMGKAAELAEMNKVEFMFEAGKCGVAVIDYETEDFNEELERVMRQ